MLRFITLTIRDLFVWQYLGIRQQLPDDRATATDKYNNLQFVASMEAIYVLTTPRPASLYIARTERGIK